jgi:hypothetical protein
MYNMQNPSAGIFGQTGFGGLNNTPIYYNINMDNKIDSDYSVDQMWDQMKEKIHEEAMYKNTVALDFSRR